MGRAPTDRAPALYVAIGASGLAGSFAWRAFLLEEQRRPRLMFDCEPYCSRIGAAHFHYVGIINPSTAEPVEEVQVVISQVERFAMGGYERGAWFWTASLALDQARRCK